jgi:membrane-bound serine protease (ClpP class)
VRRLAIALLVAAGGLGLAAQGASAAPEPSEPAAALAPVDVLQVSGLVDEIVVDEIDRAIVRAEADGSQALILQMNTRASVVGRDAMRDLYRRIAAAEVPVAIWVGPSGARLYGLPAQLLSAADATGVAPGARIGRTGTPLVDTVDLGQATEQLRTESLGFQDARRLGALKLGISDEGVPTIRNMVFALDGLTVDGVTLDTAVERVDEDGTVSNDITTVRFFKLGLLAQLFHTVASPPVAYLLLTIGLALLVFEFFTAGVGVAGLVGAACVVLGGYGVGVLPTRGWAIGLLLFAFVAFAVDVQVGIPRLWTGVGLVSYIVASFFLFEPADQTVLRPSWLTLLVGIGGVAITFVSGMPSMTRTRFATPTIGREWMIGQMGTAAGNLDPEGTVRLGAATWRARTNRATPIRAGDPVRVVAIDGITLEVEPAEGGARDYRERR